jgi:hypothetical protein
MWKWIQRPEVCRDTFVDNPDLFDINPEAVFTIVDLGTDENGVSKVAFRHKKTGNTFAAVSLTRIVIRDEA